MKIFPARKFFSFHCSTYCSLRRITHDSLAKHEKNKGGKSFYCKTNRLKSHNPNPQKNNTPEKNNKSAQPNAALEATPTKAKQNNTNCKTQKMKNNHRINWMVSKILKQPIKMKAKSCIKSKQNNTNKINRETITEQTELFLKIFETSHREWITHPEIPTTKSSNKTKTLKKKETTKLQQCKFSKQILVQH